MPKFLTVTMLSTALFATISVEARVRQPRVVRSVEMITIGSAASAADLAVAAPPAPAQLQVNDLNRRLVEFRMAQELAAPASPIPEAAEALSGLRVPPTSTIAVPTWMRGVTPVLATTAFVPGCGASAYRPTGFLKPAAEARRAAYFGMMSSVACEHGIPVGLFDAMILRESGYDPAALSTKRAFGFAQLMPDTATAMGVNRYDPLQNMHGGARYLRQQLDRFGRVELALAAYNAGPGRVRGGMVPGIGETQAYVSSIIANWQRLTSGSSSHVEVIASR